MAAAAGVWNVPVASISFTQGGALAEHVSSQNVYMGANGLVFPADVMSTNAAAIPVAVIYDTDGSVTDTLLGSGASSPSSCRQNAVTETVDSFDPAGFILHAVVILNGRCTGTLPQQQLQMQYQLERAFGRVLGLAWSQTNDNVFTGTPTPTYAQAQAWPIMHPMEILCGSYSYQCLPNPFQLRADDISGLVSLYPVATAGNGKQPSLASADALIGWVPFPTVEGMTGVNVLVRRQPVSPPVAESWYEGSMISGMGFRRAGISPFVAQDTSPAGSFGALTDVSRQGYFSLAYLPAPGGATQSLVISTEPINALYTGDYSVGPYSTGQVTPSGPALLPFTLNGVGSGGVTGMQVQIPGAAYDCSDGADGTATQPMQAPATGWWTGIFCAYGHASYVSTNVTPGRTFTLEVTGLDEQGIASTVKARPVMGVYGPADGTGLPSVAVATQAFNGLTAGTTTLTAATGTMTQVRFGIADERGEGRPDFNFQARMFYADSIAPARIAPAGATVTISGMGFRTGNAVLINGVPATVVSWTATAIVVAAPAMTVVKGTNKTALEVEVMDAGTGATSTMSGALTYDSTAGLPNAMRVVTAPAGTVYVGDQQTFEVQVLASDGVTPVAAEPVLFAVSAGQVAFAGCTTATCTVHSDANGMASVTLTPLLAGSVTLSATDGTVSRNVSFTAQSNDPAMLLVSMPGNNLPANVAAGSFTVQVVGPDGVTGLHNHSVTFSTLTGAVTFSGCFSSPCTVLTDWNGIAMVTVTPVSTGTIELVATDGDLKQTYTFQAVANAVSLQVALAPAPTNVYGWSVFKVRLATPLQSMVLSTVLFTAPAGVTITECLSSSCAQQTDGDGYAYVVVQPSKAGTFTLTATYGALSAQGTLVVAKSGTVVRILQMPADGAQLGVPTALPFQAQFLSSDGVTPQGGIAVTLAVPANLATLNACGLSACGMVTDGNGLVSSTVLPMAPGEITLSASAGAVLASASFTAIGSGTTLTIAQQPGTAGAPIGVTESLATLSAGFDGVTPKPGVVVTFQIVSGPFSFLENTNPLRAGSYGNGLATVDGVATGNGPVVVLATDGVDSVTFQFYAGTPPDVLKLVSMPANGALAGVSAGVALSVQALLPDGVTPAAGHAVTFSTAPGVARIDSCGAATCVLTADAQGMVSSTVTPLAGGSIALFAADGTANLQANFTAVLPPDVLSVVQSPASGGFAGSVAAVPFQVKAMLWDGVTPAAGEAVVVSVESGSATLGACAGASSCTLTADANGQVSTAVTPLVAGSIVLSAVDGAASVSATFTAVAKTDTLRLVSAPAGSQGVGFAAATSFAVQLLQGDGVTPDAGKAVVFSSAGAAIRFGVCASASCTVLTAADGTASTSVTPLAGGAVTLSATQGTLVQTASFMAAVLPDGLQIVSAPASGGFAGVQSAAPFTVKVLLADGVTAAVGRSVNFAVTSGSAGFGVCSGAAACALVADQNGLVTSAVTPLAPGSITLSATDGTVVQTASFTAMAKADTLRLVSAPAGSQGVGFAATPSFTVQLLQGDGVTPDAGKAVVFSVSGAAVSFSGCAALPCNLVTAADGTVGVAVTPLAAGAVTLSAMQGTLVQAASFIAVVLPDVLQVVSAPGSGGVVGAVNATPFAVKALLADGVTAAVGRSVSLAVVSGSVGFAACAGAPMCVLQTDANGLVSSAVTPTGAGAIVLSATDATVVKTVSFTAVAKPDTLRLVSAPAGSQGVGFTATASFAVQLLQGDGVTPDAGKAVVFAAAGAAVRFGACGSASCTVMTTADGTASTAVTPLAAGAVTLSATQGTLVQTASFTAVALPDVLQIVSAPASGGYVGAQSAAPFTVKVLLADGVTAAAGRSINLAVASGSAGFAACSGASACALVADQNGLVTSAVTPLAAGSITLSATDATVVQTTSFTAVAKPDTLRLVSVPSGSQGVGVVATPSFVVQLLQGDGVTPDAGKAVVFSSSGAPVSFSGCAALPCTLATAADGTVGVAVTPLAAGSVSLLASFSSLTQAAGFAATVLPDLMEVVSVPSSGGYVGTANPVAFAVKVLLADGVTAAAGRGVVMAVTGGSAGLAACSGAASCTLTADAQGLVSTAVTPLSGETISLSASDGAVVQTASFSAIARPDTMRLVSAPASGSGVGVVAGTGFAVQVLAGDGVTPEAGKLVTFSGTAGAVQFGACGGATCTIATGSDGVARTSVTPLVAGSIALLASEGALSQAAAFTAVTLPDVLQLVSAPASGGFVGAANVTPFAVRVLLADGVTPVAGELVSLSVVSGSAGLAACNGGSACMLRTDATGLVSTVVTPGAAGNITLQLADGSSTQMATFTAVANRRSVVATTPGIFVAEGQTVSTTLAAMAMQNGVAAGGVAIAWTGSTGFAVLGLVGVAAADGSASMAAVAGPLSAGQQASATVCAWATVCASFTATGVANAALQAGVLTGANQSVTGGAAPSPVIVQVADPLGDAVAGSPVAIYQTVTALDAACPVHGRCPAAPILLEQASTAVADAQGRVAIVPLTIPGTATNTQIAVSTGTQGFASTVISSAP